ncbi:MAG: arginine deiminase family protein [Melioribacteraceae bacterium]|nr:arginine deiminase family protein [Melioribacteraceae bacterium]
MNANVNSEIGELESVIVHTPGQEVENMTPQNAERALYSDILNLSVAKREYKQFKSALNKLTKVYEVSDLLTDILKKEEAKINVVENICRNEGIECIKEYLYSLPPKELARQLIEGVLMVKDTLTKFLNKDRYSLLPLHNFFFTRDASISIGERVFISKMSSPVREREALIMEAIFKYHPELNSETINPRNIVKDISQITFEGGDILVVRDDILCIGIGMRTSTQGVDFIINELKKSKTPKHIIVQELPQTLESFIHLDMVFTFLDKDACLIYDPVVFNQHSFETVHIRIDNGKVDWIREEANILEALRKIKIHLKPISCGGNSDDWIQEREQWHSGANFFAVAPGKVLGYGRNSYTIDALNKNGFDVIKSEDLSKTDLNSIQKYVITVEGSELSRGGGGCRCMTMPVRRKEVKW